ncbi:hypothetical protein ACWEWU_09360 [Staphylococcus xylosus]
MNIKRGLKITLLIVILVEEIRSATNKNSYKVDLDIDSSKLIEKVEEIKSHLNN